MEVQAPGGVNRHSQGFFGFALMRSMLSWRGASAFAVASAGWQVLAVVRGLLVARLAGPDLMSEVSVVLVTVAFLETAAFFNPYWLMASDSRGSRRTFVQVMNGLAMARGVLLAVCVVSVAPLVSDVFGLDGLRTPIASLAFVFLVRGFLHSDTSRSLLRGRYRVAILQESAGLVCEAGVFVAGYAMFGSVWVTVVGLFAGAVARVIVSRWWATTSWRVYLPWGHLRTVLGYSWPLIVSNQLLFVSRTSDRVIVGTADRDGAGSIDPALMGQLAVLQNLAEMPSAVFGRVVDAVAVSGLSRRRARPQSHALYVRRLLSVALGSAVGTWAIGCVGAEQLLRFALGSGYQSILFVVPVVFVGVGLQIWRSCLNKVLLVSGRTDLLLVGNMVRAAGAVIALAVVLMGNGLTAMLVSGVLMEGLAGLFVLACLWRLGSVPLGLALRSQMVGVAALLLIGVVEWLVSSGGEYSRLALGVVFAPLMGGAAGYMLRGRE